MQINWINLTAISFGLAMDAFAVSIGVGASLKTVTPRHVFRLAFHFGLFQFLMPIVGWLAGEQVAVYVGTYGHWAAFALLGYVGVKMLWEARFKNITPHDRDPTRGLTLAALSIATSIDALAVGLSMAFGGVAIWIPSAVIGLVAAAMTTLGAIISKRISARWGRSAEVAGGILLILIGIKMLVGGFVQ